MSKRILVIDDDKDILSVLEIIFRHKGYETILHNTGTTLDNIKMLQPDLILLDVRITGFNKTGDQICQEIKSLAEISKVPVLLISAEENVAKLAEECGANGFVNKPFDIHYLLTKVQEFVN